MEGVEATYGDRLSTGCTSLDRLLGGGFARRSVSQLYGAPGTGKTNVCLQTAVEAAESGGEAVYVDTEGLSAERLRQVGSEEAAARIRVKEVFDFDMQEQAVSDVETVAADADLVVLDSATGLYRAERDDGDDTPLTRLTRQVVHLTSLARRHDVAVVLTNQVYTEPETETYESLGGNAMEHWSQAIVRLERLDGGRRRATLDKHPFRPTGESAEFEITGDGVE
ncbi:MAG: DNA repair and recombination protein RadB [Halobacteriales archaeon]